MTNKVRLDIKTNQLDSKIYFAADFITRQNFTTAQIAASKLPLHFLAIAFIGAIC